MADDSPQPLQIVEVGVPDAISVTFEDDDLPHGRRRERAAWQEGGTVKLGEQGGTYLPGSSKPILHPLYSTFRPRTLKGALRDHLVGVAGHARKMRDDLERIRLRANMLRISWDLEGFTGFLVESTFGIEDAANITYELQFIVEEPFGLAEQDSSASVAHPDAGPDLVAQMVQAAAANRAELEALSMSAAVSLVILAAQGEVETALGTALEAVTQLESGQVGQGQQMRQAVASTIGAALGAAASATALAAAVDGLGPVDVLPVVDAAGAAAWSVAQADAILFASKAADAMRSVAQQARAKLLSSRRLYLVQPGDTLDRVALAALGSRARVEDLGLTPAQLAAAVGSYIALPEA